MALIDGQAVSPSAVPRPRIITDRTVAREIFERDRQWAAWALCLMSDEDWPSVRFSMNAASTVGVWILDHSWWGGSIQTFGQGADLDSLIRAVHVPRRAFLRLTAPVLASVGSLYTLTRVERIVRMSVTESTLRMPLRTHVVEPLDADDVPDLSKLYAEWPAAKFSLRRLHRGYRYWGIRQGGSLVAVVENALRTSNRDLAIVQGVLVHPERRGQGLAQAVTGAVTRRLFEEGARDVVLDVKAENAPAIGAYARLGFQAHCTYLGGPAESKRPPDPSYPQ